MINRIICKFKKHKPRLFSYNGFPGNGVWGYYCERCGLERSGFYFKRMGCEVPTTIEDDRRRGSE